MSMICAMVLAAGRSRRMGTQKLLLPLEGRPVIVRVVDELLRSPADRVFVVVGEEGKPILEALAGRPVQFVTNLLPEGDMLSSVRCGLTAMPGDCAAALVALGDQPGISADVVAGLVRSFRSGDRGIVVPTHKGRRGHPLLFAMRYREKILTGYEDRGLRGLLDAHPQDVLEVEVSAPGILEDLDVPEDYRRAIGRLSNGPHG
jgi:molybdenum cofactor cytidylyltransferase